MENLDSELVTTRVQLVLHTKVSKVPRNMKFSREFNFADCRFFVFRYFRLTSLIYCIHCFSCRIELRDTERLGTEQAVNYRSLFDRRWSRLI